MCFFPYALADYARRVGPPTVQRAREFGTPAPELGSGYTRGNTLKHEIGVGVDSVLEPSRYECQKTKLLQEKKSLYIYIPE